MVREKEKRKLLENQTARLTEELSRYLLAATFGDDDEEDEKSTLPTSTTAATTIQQPSERSWVDYFSSAASRVSIATSRIVGNNTSNSSNNVGNNNNNNENNTTNIQSNNQQSTTARISNAFRRLSDVSKTAVLKNISTQKNNTNIPATIAE